MGNNQSIGKITGDSVQLTGPLGLTIHSTRLSNPFMQFTNNSRNLLRIYSTQQVPDIKKVIFQKLHTIVIWEDGEKTVVKCSEEEFDKEKGLAMAIAKRLMDRNKFKRLIKEADIQDK